MSRRAIPSGMTEQDKKALFDNRHVLTDRTPNGMRQRVIQTFCSEENIKYLITVFKKMMMPGKSLSYILDHIHEDVIAFAPGIRSGPGGDLIDSDSLARRGFAGNSTSLWGEVRTMNTAFYYNRLSLSGKTGCILKEKVAMLLEKTRKIMHIECSKQIV